MSSFVEHHIQNLPANDFFEDWNGPEKGLSTTASSFNGNFHNLLATLKNDRSPTTLRSALAQVEAYERSTPRVAFVNELDGSDLRSAVVRQLIVGFYAETLERYLSEASDTEAEAEWWADVDSSSLSRAHYFLQTLPQRVYDASSKVLDRIRTIPSLPSSQAVIQLFESQSDLQPSAFLLSFFPFLQFRPHLFALTTIRNKAAHPIAKIFRFLTLPLYLSRQELQLKKAQLEELRDSRATILGTLAEMRNDLAKALDGTDKFEGSFDHFVESLDSVIRDEHDLAPPAFDDGVLSKLSRLARTTLPKHTSAHLNYFSTLQRPSPRVLLWPRLILLPPLMLYGASKIYSARFSLEELINDTLAAMDGFVRGWIIEPLKDVLHTVRAGGEEAVIVRKEGIQADADSLERMALSLAKDKLHYTPDQIEAFSKQVRLGDLTPVLLLYENEIRSPVSSALSGSLVRSLLIQVQKAKVDVGQVLSGIDKLLRSQELTFAFVGVAPAAALAYVAISSLSSLIRLFLGSTRSQRGAKSQRRSVWSAMRRIERLLTSHSDKPGEIISARTSGLLILSLARVRAYASRLPQGRLRSGLLEDVGDLENPALSGVQKRAVVERMWRCWGRTLEWGTMGGQ